MEPFREVRSPERNYGPARLPGGTVVTPLARRLAGEAGIDLAKIKGSGPHGRIVAADIEQARSTAAPALAPAAASAQIVLTADIAIAEALALCARCRCAFARRRDRESLGHGAAARHAGRACRHRACGREGSRADPRCGIALAHRDRGGAARGERGRATRRDRDLHRRGGRHRVGRARGPSAADHDAEHRLAPPRADRGGGWLGRVRRDRDGHAVRAIPARSTRRSAPSCLQPSRDLSNGLLQCWCDSPAGRAT